MQFFLDEDLSHQIAAIVRQHGIDIISPHESGGKGLTDRQQLLLAAQDGRCVVTRNYGDFVRRTLEFQEQGLPHAGVALVPKSLPGRRFAAIAAAIIEFNAEHPQGIPPYSVLWLKAEHD